LKEETITITLFVINSVAALCAAVFAILTYRRAGHLTSGPTDEQLRSHIDRILQFSDGQSRNLREEIGGTMRGFQDSTLKAFRELGETWRAPCLWRPLPASIAGGAGARPDHSITGHVAALH
jgi:hypothetical protein